MSGSVIKIRKATVICDSFTRDGLLISFFDREDMKLSNCCLEYFREFHADALNKINHKNVLHFFTSYGLCHIVDKIIALGTYYYEGIKVVLTKEEKQPNYFSYNGFRFILKSYEERLNVCIFNK